MGAAENPHIFVTCRMDIHSSLTSQSPNMDVGQTNGMLERLHLYGFHPEDSPKRELPL